MQNYGQQPSYQRPGSTASFAGQQAAPPPPGYGAPQGYQSGAPQAQSQWAAPTPTQVSNPWNQPQPQAGGGYNPGIYGAMPGGQQHASSAQSSYAPQQHDQPPPPPPKPYGFAGAVQQQQQHQISQGWSQQSQQNTGFTPQTQQGGYPVHGTPQQPYNAAAPPPPSATPGGSYFPPAQAGRPTSIYGANLAGTYSNTPTASAQQPSNVMSPNEQQPAYIPPSLTGQGVQAYMPSNTNPAPGVYVPPPPDLPAWQQAQHAPLQGGVKKFRYTKPTVDPSFYAQGYQGIQPMQPAQPPPPQGQFGQPGIQPQQPQQPYGQPAQNQFVPQGQIPQQVAQPQYPQQQPLAQYKQPTQPQQQPFGQPVQPQGHFPQPPQYDQSQQGQQMQPPASYSQQQNQWQPPASTDQLYGQQQQQQQHQTPYGSQQPEQQPEQQSQWQVGHQSQDLHPGQQFPQTPDHGIQAPKPLSRTDTAPSTFFNQASPQSQPVSPVNNRHSMSFAAGHQTGLGRAGSVSSIALANLHAQRADNRTSSPKPAPAKVPTPPPPRDDKSKFSALGTGGPSDWEHFGVDDEIDDEEFFGSKKDIKKVEAVQLDSVELPAHVPSPPSTHGWPSPATHPVPSTSSDRQESYAPTPPPATASPARRPPSQPPHQSFVIGDAAIAPLRTTPKPIQATQPPPVQESFVVGDGAWVPPKQGTPVQQHSHQLPPSQQGFVMDDGGWAAQSEPSDARQLTPAQHQQQPPPVATGIVTNDRNWNLSQETPTQTSGAWGAQVNDAHVAELQAKDEAFQTLQADFEKEKIDLHTEIEKLKGDVEKLRGDVETAKISVDGEKNVLHEQIEQLKNAATQAKTYADALVKEKDITIDRMTEDVEGKEHNIQERDATIAELRRQLETEKAKEVPKPKPLDLIPDIDPWYVGSLERYITMLRSEATEPEIEAKIKTFRSFLKAESGIRGIDFYDAPPPTPAPVVEPLASHTPEKPALSRGASHSSTRRQEELNVHVPQEPPTEEDYDYSPGGRPVLRRKVTLPFNEGLPNQQHFNSSAQSTTILTPTSSVDDDSNKTPVQSPPEEHPPAQYKAYVPPAGIPNDPTPLTHRHTMSFSNPPVVASPSGPSRGHDEIFFGAPKPESTTNGSRPVSSDSTMGHVSIPAPLSCTPNRPTTTAPTSRKAPVNILADLLPTQTTSASPSHIVEELRTRFAGITPSAKSLEELTKTWDKSTSLGRRKRDDARRKRTEENEEHNEDLFNSNEISYAEMNQLEDDFKQKEGVLKAQEDRDEYKTYVEAVFDAIYDGLQSDIKMLMDIYYETENLLHTSVAGVRQLAHSDEPGTKDCLELVKDIHEQVEKRHESVVLAVADRDKRYKKTEIQPLYAAGNIARMKAVEKHFESAEKEAALRAKREKAERVGELVNLTEDIVVRAVSVEQGEIDHILTAVKDLEDENGDLDLLARAHMTLSSLKASSKALLRLLNGLEIELNNSVLDTEIAQVKAEGADAARLQALEKEKEAGAKKMSEEYERKVKVLEADEAEIAALVKRKGGGAGAGQHEGEGSEELEKDRRLKAALEEAKRRNGDA